MIPFRYRITLFDPLFYAREGLSASHTPNVLHATAINGAVSAALNINSEAQPFVIADNNGGMDTPRYENSLITDKFYFTPAAISGSADDWPEIVKGDNEGFFFRVVAGEILKASRLHFVAPESQFVGLGLVWDRDVRLPERIRLGSFRGVARLETEFATKFKPLPANESHTVDHPVDPLVSTVKRGVMNNMFPYPVVQNASCQRVFEVTFEGKEIGKKKHMRLAWPNDFETPKKPERVKSGPSAII